MQIGIIEYDVDEWGRRLCLAAVKRHLLALIYESPWREVLLIKWMENNTSWTSFLFFTCFIIC